MARKEKGLTQKELASSINVDLDLLDMWENEMAVPSEIQLRELAPFLDTTYEALTSDVREESPKAKEIRLADKGKTALPKPIKRGSVWSLLSLIGFVIFVIGIFTSFGIMISGSGPFWIGFVISGFGFLWIAVFNFITFISRHKNR